MVGILDCSYWVESQGRIYKE